MISLFLMLKHNLVEHEPSDNINDDVHDDAQPSNDNDMEIEPAKKVFVAKKDFVARKQ